MPLPGGEAAALDGLRVATVFPRDVTAGPPPAMALPRTATAFLRVVTVIQAATAFLLRAVTGLQVATQAAVVVRCGG